MRRMLWIVPASLATLGVVSAVLGAPSRPPAGWVDRVYADFRNQHARGQVQVDRIDADSSRLTVALAKLLPGHRYRVIFSSDPCSTPLAGAENLGQKWFRADSDGTVFSSVLLGLGDGTFRAARTTRLMEEEGIYYFCHSASRLRAVANLDNADVALARFSGDVDGLGFIRVDTTSMELMASLDGLKPDARYRMVLSTLTCSEFMAGDPDNPVWIPTGRADTDGLLLASRTESVSKDESITIGGMRIESYFSHVVRGCANVRFFDVWTT